MTLLRTLARAVRFLAGVRERGIRKSYRTMLALAGDLVFDLRHGTDTGGRLKLRELAIDSANRERGVHYQPTRVLPLRRLLTSLALPTDRVFVDFGAGKGRVLLVASEYGFREVVGVEFSPELCQLARRNVELYRASTGSETTIRVLAMDAVDYRVRRNDSVFFFFNPFDEIVMAQVVDNIMMSVRCHPRRVWVIYNRPLHEHLLRDNELFGHVEEFEDGSTTFSVYSN